ncbi:MAG TPA: long-chain fatty acid--CoA ligase [Gaiellaceae bacterium]|nr:long-chain fatty acid--CoA ligase [Gaiellaceae bacterium]
MTETTTAAPGTGVPHAQRTIARLWRDGIAARRSNPAYLVEGENGWREVSWADADERIREYANGFLARGIGKSDAVAILAQTSLDWVFLDFALAHVGAVVIPIYASSSTRDVAYLLGHSDAVGIVCEDAGQREKVDEVAAELPALRELLSFDDLDELAAAGRRYAETHPTALDDAISALAEDDLYTIIYTSGTTGPPKGCMISHRNYHAMATTVDSMDSFLHDDDLMLLYLPLAHNFGKLMMLEGAHAGFTIALLSDPLRVADALLEVRPTVLPSVPRVYEKIHSAVVARFDAETGLRKRIVDWSLPVGREVARLRVEGKPVPRILALRHAVADRLVFAKVRARLGGRLRTPISGGAPLSREVAHFFDGMGIRLIEGYGLTECTTACTTNRPDLNRFGTVGTPLPSAEVRIAEDGEILVRGETVFQGYYKDPEATAATFTADGWLKTGDVGSIDEDGFLTITDRKKDIIVTAGGKNVAPQNIENDLKASKYVSQALVVGDRRPYVAALITLDAAELGRWAAERGLDGDLATLARDPQVAELVQGIVDGVNESRSRYEQIKRFVLLSRDFTLDEGELTPTLKVRRPACVEHFQAEVEQLYA